MALPFLFTTTTAAAAAAARLAGPMSIAQVVALLFRIKKVRIAGEISHDLDTDPPEATTTAGNFVVPRCKPSDEGIVPVVNEAEILVLSEISCEFSDDGFSGFDVDISGIRKDEAGSYWCIIGVSTGEGLPEANGEFVGGGLGEPGDFELDAILTIAGEEVTVPILARGLNVTAAECAITVEEWWPYATTAGAAAWNTTTGAAINGGPGA